VPFTAGSAESVNDWIYYVGSGLSIGMWMYSGYESMSTVAGELENPQAIPKATLITVPLIMATYIFPTMSGLASMGRWEEWGEDALGYADVAKTQLGGALGDVAGVAFIIVAIVAQCSIYNTYIASGSRGFFALAGDHLAPPLLVKVDKRYGVPYVAVLSIAAVNLVLCNFAFETAVVVDVFLLVASYVMVYISCIVLRKRIPREEYPFRIPGGDKLLFAVCVVPVCVAFVSFMINGTDYFIGGMLGIVSGPLLYLAWKKRYGGLAINDPAAHPLNGRTGLARGDLKRMAVMFMALGYVGAFGRFFLPWYEAGRAAGRWLPPDYALSEAEREIVAVSEDGMLYMPGYYEQEYGTGLFADWEAMLSGITIATAICLVAAAALALAARRFEK
jgi:amino acid transporter